MKKILVESSAKRSLPLYIRIKRSLREQILNGKYGPGEKFPTEAKLEESFGVSKITVRKALSELENENLIVRNQGIGTFISDRIPIKEYKVFAGDVQSIINILKDYEVKAVEITEISSGDARLAKTTRDFFGIGNEDRIGLIKLIRSLKENPVLYFEIFIPTDLLKYLTIKNLKKQAILKTLKENINLSIGRGELSFEAILAESDIADILKCPEGGPIILSQVMYWLTSGKPLVLINLYMGADKLKYKIDLDVKTFLNI